MQRAVNDADDKPPPKPLNLPANPPRMSRAEREARLAKALRDNLRRRKGPGRDPQGHPSDD